MGVVVDGKAAVYRGCPPASMGLGWRIDPADIAVRTAVNQVHPAVARVAEDHDRGAGQIEFRYGLADRQRPEHRGRFRDDDRIEFGDVLVAFVRGRLDHVTWRIDRRAIGARAMTVL